MQDEIFKTAMPSKSASPAGKIYQIKITLLDIVPEIWRRLLVPSSTSLAAFHYLLQTAMGWENSHMHAFRIRGKEYGINYDGEEIFSDDANDVFLADFHFRSGSKFYYTYDFGDSWRHGIVVEAVSPPDPEERYPVCIGGERACPPEDCGGAWGYLDLVRVIRNPEDPNREDLLEWLGGEFDPSDFDPGTVNRALERSQFPA
ncbi:MAG: plasmid pRiA4b ORF-3 family protein [Gammaproteobacteria bacterium]